MTVVTRHRYALFADFAIGAAAARALADPVAWVDSTLLCWVLMPDHLHALIELGAEPLPLAVARVKARVSRRLGVMLGRAVNPWMPGFHDHALRRDEALRDAARYIVMNPVRAGLVRRIGDYPLWGAVWIDRVSSRESGRG